ncbi:MAG: hypothetical protein ACK4RK_18395 [Gemmataceae bacterium]
MSCHYCRWVAFLLCFLGPIDLLGAEAPSQPAAELSPSRVTLRKTCTLSEALDELRKQTSIQVLDRSDAATARLKLNLDQVTFWQALDTIAQEADLRVSLHEGGRQIALIDGPYRELPVSYDGLFRITVKKVLLLQDFETDVVTGLAQLEVAWEPKFRAFLLQTQPRDLVVVDDKGRQRLGESAGRGQAPVHERLSYDLQVSFPAPPRSALRLASFEGKLEIIGADKMLTFVFDKPERGQSQKQDGVTVLLDSFIADDELWTVGFTLTYPPEGPKFESFQSSLLNNEIHLAKNGKRYPANGGYEIDDNQARYRFVADPDINLKLGRDKTGWKIEYQTPGRIQEVPIRFQFQDVPLP